MRRVRSRRTRNDSGWRDYFDVIIDSHIVGVAKPDPRIFQIALERLGVGPDEVRFAGDIYSIDVEGARAAGIEARLIDQHRRYTWVEHEKIRHIGGAASARLKVARGRLKLWAS